MYADTADGCFMSKMHTEDRSSEGSSHVSVRGGVSSVSTANQSVDKLPDKTSSFVSVMGGKSSSHRSSSQSYASVRSGASIDEILDRQGQKGNNFLGKGSTLSSGREHNDKRNHNKPCCISCFQEDEIREATHFCKTCGTDGKYICYQCLKYHERFTQHQDDVTSLLTYTKSNGKKSTASPVTNQVAILQTRAVVPYGSILSNDHGEHSQNSVRIYPEQVDDIGENPTIFPPLTDRNCREIKKKQNKEVSNQVAIRQTRAVVPYGHNLLTNRGVYPQNSYGTNSITLHPELQLSFRENDTVFQPVVLPPLFDSVHGNKRDDRENTQLTMRQTTAMVPYSYFRP